MLWSTFAHQSHHGLGGYSKLINGLRAAVSGAFCMLLMSELTVHMLKMYCKEGTSVVLSSTTLHSFIHSFIHNLKIMFIFFKILCRGLSDRTGVLVLSQPDLRERLFPGGVPR